LLNPLRPQVDLITSLGHCLSESGIGFSSVENIKTPLVVGRFAPPLFKGPQAQDLSRVGVVDIGSNSVRLVVFDGAARSPAYFYNEKVMAGLGQGMIDTGFLSAKGRTRALLALKRFATLAKEMCAGPLIAVATAAVREAKDGPDFEAEVLAETGIAITIIDGAEEARLSAQGVLLGWPDARGIVCDIGGNSMELARISDAQVGLRSTAPLGPFRLEKIEAKDRKSHIQSILRPLQIFFNSDQERLYLVGGSWRVIAKIDMERRNYPLRVLHEYRMKASDLIDTLDWIQKADLPQLRRRIGTSSERLQLVPIASEVLREMVNLFNPSEIDISAYGIREGLLYEQMSPELRAQDPLIAAARAAEASLARMPGFGRVLFEFILPIFGDVSFERLRLIKAACLLHDTSWRAHPDYRAEACFDNATHSNLGGLDHMGRLFLGMALLHRYKNSRNGTNMKNIFDLLPEDTMKEAEILGKAMRFGAMFSLGDLSQAGRLACNKGASVLTLYLYPRGINLYGEVAKSRFESLASSLNCTAQVAPQAQP
jgi:exopolyphosphatase/guanosine-5'-triphosphate,3'-diphosphate pyrophosphatase